MKTNYYRQLRKCNLPILLPAVILGCVVLSGLIFSSCASTRNAYGNGFKKTLKDSSYEEIRYIGSKKELAHFDSLETKDEINQFVEEFWKKRDPTKGTPENEMREEVDRRIAYADSMLGGAQFDRGRVYIIYGKPHEIRYFDWHKEGGMLAHMDNESDENRQPVEIEHQPVTLRANALEVWIYNVPIRHHPNPSIFDNYENIDRAMVKFVFADISSFGLMEQIYSTEKGEKCDPRVFLTNPDAQN